MIFVRAQMTIHADHRAAFLHHMNEFVLASRQEDGCLSFGCYEDVTHPNAFIVLEEWHDHEAFTRHESAAHLATFKVHLLPMLVSREPTRVYTVNDMGGLS